MPNCCPAGDSERGLVRKLHPSLEEKVQHIEDRVSSNPIDTIDESQGLCVAVLSKPMVGKTNA